MDDKKDKHIESLAQRVRELQFYTIQVEEDYKNEITAQNGLIDAIKQSNSDLKKRSEGLIETIEEMQRLLQTANESHNELQTSFRDNQSRLSDQLNESLEQNSILVKELDELKESANRSKAESEYDLGRHYPSASSAKRLLDKDLSFTTESKSMKQELEDQKRENSVLKNHLLQLTTESEENAPLLHLKICEHQRALQNISELQKQLSSIVTEREHWLQEKDTLLRTNKQYEREIQRFENENKDLSKQIRGLIKSVQEARGFSVYRGQQDSQISSTGGGVPQGMVAFKDIEELQIRNQELMNALRETNEKLKLTEDNKEDERRVLQKDLDDALLQLEGLRAERRQQSEILEMLVKQKDFFRMLSTNTTSDKNQIQKSALSFTFSPFSSVNRISAEEHNELKSNFERVSKEYERYREETTERVKELTVGNEALRQEVSNLKIQMAKTSSELTFTQEMLELFKTNGEQFQSENVLLRERITTFTNDTKSLEQNVIVLRQELLSANEKISGYEVNIENIKCERDLHRNNELKLIHEKEILIKNEENLNKVINTLQTVQNNYNQMESDSIKDLKTQNANLEKEINYWRIKCEKDEEKHSETTVLWEKQSQDLQNRIDSELQKYSDLHKELTEFQTKVKNLENELNCIKTKPIPAIAPAVNVLPIAATNVSVPTEANASIQENLNTITQLRKVARKYKQQYDELRVEYDKHMDASANTDGKGNASSDQSITGLLHKIDELNAKNKELEQRIEKMNIELNQVIEERENAKTLAMEKEDKAKKIALQAKQRLASLAMEKQNVIKDKESVEKTVEELRETNKILVQNVEECSLRMASIKSQFDGKTNRLELELKEAKELIKQLQSKSKVQIETQKQSQQTTQTIGSNSVSVQPSSQTTSNPVRHSVHPQPATVQPLSAKSTPTASIRPLAVAPTLHRSGHPVNVSARTATVATVQPTTDNRQQELSVHQSVPQATVQPTQTVSQSPCAAPASSAEPESMIPLAEDMERFETSFNQNESQDIIQQEIDTFVERNVSLEPIPTLIDVSQASTSMALSICWPLLAKESQETTSSIKIDRNKEKVTLKRSRRNSEELSAPLSPKKLKTDSDPEAIKPEEMTSQEITHEVITSELIPLEVKTSETIAPEVIAPEVKISEEITPEMITPEVIAPEVITPEVITPEVITPEVITPEVITPEVITPEVITSEDLKSESVSESQTKDSSQNEVVEGVDEDEDDDDIIEIYSDEEQNDDMIEDNDDEEEDEEEEYDEEEVIDDSEEENIDDNEEVYDNEEEEDEGNEEPDGESEDIEIGDTSDDMPDLNQEAMVRSQQSSQTSVSEPNDPTVSTTMSSLATTPVVTSSTESNPFIQIPTPIQRSFVTSGRQSLYLSHAQQSSAYDEGDGIVPSTPTLFVPRRGDSFSDALNSPRVPQSRFVFSSSIPESTPLSQLETEVGTEGSLGVDDTRMDLSQFDDNNNGRSVPTTPLATSPVVDTSADSNLQSIEVDNESDPNFGVNPNAIETEVPNDFDGESDSKSVETEVVESTQSEPNVELLSETQTQELMEEEKDPKNDETMTTSECIPTTSQSTTSPSQRGVQTARRGRSFGLQRGGLQRRPIMAPISESSSAIPPARLLGQTQKTVRPIRPNKFIARGMRGTFRGRPTRGGFF